MKKHSIKSLITFLVLVISIFVVSSAFGQGKQEIPKDFFMGKWGGTIKGEEWRKDGIGSSCGTETKYSYTMKILYLILVLDEEMYEITPEMKDIIENLKKRLGDKFPQQSVFKYKGWAEIKVKQEMFKDIGSDCTNKLDLDNLSAKVPIEVTFNLENGNSFWFDILSDEKTVHLKSEWIARLKSGEIAEHDKGESYASIKCFVTPKGGKFIVEKNKIVIKDKFERGNDEFWSQCKITGELHGIVTKKDTLGKTVQIDEPIKTDKFTQRDIVVPAVSEIPDFPYEISKVYVFGNTDCIFTSENEMHLVSGEVVIFEDVNWSNIDMDKIVSSKPEISDIELGEITTKLDKLREEGYDFKVETPQAGCGVRGTQFITKVEKDGTTTLTVLDGEVEFSDKAKKKTIIVKKNQISVVNPGGLPSEPVSIDPKQIPRWWE